MVAIDQRGYGRSSKYRVQKAYRIKELVGDVVGVLDSYGAEQAFVVGHDWGAPVAWTFAWLHPDRCAGVVGISVPFAGRGVIGLPGSLFGERRPSDYHLSWPGPEGSGIRTISPCRTASSPRSRKTCGAGCSG